MARNPIYNLSKSKIVEKACVCGYVCVCFTRTRRRRRRRLRRRREFNGFSLATTCVLLWPNTKGSRAFVFSCTNTEYYARVHTIESPAQCSLGHIACRNSRVFGKRTHVGDCCGIRIRIRIRIVARRPLNRCAAPIRGSVTLRATQRP